ncbi:MAG: hypothetical protein R2795_01640 [Saprospiraceae bacterium]
MKIFANFLEEVVQFISVKMLRDGKKISDPIFGLALCTKRRNTCTKRVHKDKPSGKMGSVISVKMLSNLCTIENIQGKQDFPKLRNEGFVYVDKTRYATEMAVLGDHILCPNPAALVSSIHQHLRKCVFR